MILVAVVFGMTLGTGAAARTIETVTIPVERDTTIMEAHPRDNDGSWGFLWLKWNSARGFENRVLLGFDLSALSGRAADVAGATIVLRAADHTFPRRGTSLSTYFMDPLAAVSWSEGDRQFDTFAYCGRRDLFRPPSGEGGPGATWSCEDDDGTTDPLGIPVCGTPNPGPWLGGLPSQGEAALPRGFRRTPTTTQVETRDYDPLCRRALTCYDTSGSADCWRAVRIDVTDDVREALSLGVVEVSWLLKKDRVEAGAARWFSREGAICRLGLPELAPRLDVRLASDENRPVTIPSPEVDCGFQ